MNIFYLDKLVFDFIYHQCFKIGSIFCMKAFEGFIIYLSIFSLAIIKGLNKNDN